MGVKSGCIVVAALILIPAVFLSGCINQDARRLDILEEANQKLQGQPDGLKNNQSAPIPAATPAQTTNESLVEKLKREREQAESKLTPTPVPATSEPTPIDTAQYVPASITPSPTPAPVTTTPRQAPILTPTLTPVLSPTATPMSTPAPISTPEKMWSFRRLSLSNFHHYIENQ